MAIKRLFIANRGEIAVRIIRSARSMGIHTIQAYSEADVDSLAVRYADEAVLIGKPPAAKSYLNIEAVLAGAKKTKADAVHPGYGFLAENGDFADAVEAAGLIFVGPRGNTIRHLADKVAARSAANAAGLPTVPGSSGRVSANHPLDVIDSNLEFPVLIKAAAGGGGRGIRIARDEDEFCRLAPQAAIEAQSAFGDNGIYVEAYIENARHIEVQVIGDGSRTVHFYDRECSLQRNRQKIWEEAPASVLSTEIREKLCQSAVAFSESVGYRSAGTMEFLYDVEKEKFYFLEMNTRIQVEHPVTECITAVDLIRESILVADSGRLHLNQEDIVLNGHSIECRINAEDPVKGFMPSPGTVAVLNLPGGPGVRFDSMLFSGCQIPPYYDSLVGKLIVWDDSREQALQRMKVALNELEIEGISTTKLLHQALVDDWEIRNGEMHIQFLDAWLDQSMTQLTAMGDE
ncbi:MAG: acetyl-CoA carboxylase biotin carboxylase subunit [Acidiferrobacterales bacterium]|nr:acetyl-CoA carboxylase biotin carboxylase subunit [Acidiferrobacterales bacterium]